MILVGVGLIKLASPEGIALMQRLWSPIGNALITAITWLLAILLAPFNPLLERLAALMARGWLELLQGPLGQFAQSNRANLSYQKAQTLQRKSWPRLSPSSAFYAVPASWRR